MSLKAELAALDPERVKGVIDAVAEKLDGLWHFDREEFQLQGDYLEDTYPYVMPFFATVSDVISSSDEFAADEVESILGGVILTLYLLSEISEASDLPTVE